LVDGGGHGAAGQEHLFANGIDRQELLVLEHRHDRELAGQQTGAGDAGTVHLRDGFGGFPEKSRIRAAVVVMGAR